MAVDLIDAYGDIEKQDLEDKAVEVSIAGRMMSRRVMGKASFAHLQDRTERIQVYVARDALAEGLYNDEFKKWDIGDLSLIHI